MDGKISDLRKWAAGKAIQANESGDTANTMVPAKVKPRRRIMN